MSRHFRGLIQTDIDDKMERRDGIISSFAIA